MAHILLVEDDPHLADIYQHVLTRAGHQVSVVHNGQEALDRAPLAPRPDVILMDLQMPVMDGLEATERLKASPELAAIPVFALTNLQLPAEVSAALEAGCDGYLSKPTDPHDLARELALMLGAD